MTNDAAKPHPPWFDPRLPDPRDSVLRHMLDSRAARYPDRRVAAFESGVEWTYSQCQQRVRAAAQALQSLGIRKGDRVVAWLPNGEHLVLAWLAINYLGAVFVPLNTAYRGRILEHVIRTCRAKLMIAHEGLIGRLADLDLGDVERLICAGIAPDTPLPRPVLPLSVLDGDADALVALEPVGLDDITCIIYTSGTTGPSKGVLSPYLQLYTSAVCCYGYLGEGETILVNLPLFHIGGTSALYCALIRSGAIYVVDGFDTQRYWDQVRRAGASSSSGLVGVMAAFLAKEPPRPNDRDNPLRCLTMFPINDETIAFSRRFGFDYLTGFNMSEVSVPLVTDVNTPIQGSCGRPRTGVECRLVDANDVDVPEGAVGELLVRTEFRAAMNAGYDGMPEATANVWRNGWFHTGDAFRRDSSGEYFFVDRLKDAIRRRGENISSLEVEAVVREYPDVAETVAVAVPGKHGEDEVLIAVVSKPGRAIDPLALTEFLVPRLPYFMVPRYIRVVPEIPKTETNKQRKVFFREAGITPDTWDREAAGVRLKRERLS